MKGSKLTKRVLPKKAMKSACQKDVNGGIVLFKNGVSVHISDDGFIKTVVGKAKIIDTWELIK